MMVGRRLSRGVDSARAALVLSLQALLVGLAMPAVHVHGQGEEGSAGVGLVELVGPVLRTFRVSQTWFLYRDGPDNVHRLEVYADDALVYSSGDDDPAWLAGPLGDRRVRPVVESTCKQSQPGNWAGLVRYVTARVRDERPTTHRVELQCTVGPFPGVAVTTQRAYAAEAPGWTPVAR